MRSIVAGGNVVDILLNFFCVCDILLSLKACFAKKQILQQSGLCFLIGVMIKVPHKWSSTFIMSSFRWKLAYLMHILTALRMCVKSQSKVETFFLTFYRSYNGKV